MTPCSIDGCEMRQHARGLCSTHHGRLLRTGTTDSPLQPLAARFWKYVDKTATCWLWTGACSPQGYGLIFEIERHRQIGAHRASYEMHKGPIPDGLVIDHLCRVHNCVNPDHLEPVTKGENTRRGLAAARRRAQAARQTACKRGHDFTPENTRRDKRGARHCRACDRTRGQREAA